MFEPWLPTSSHLLSDGLAQQEFHANATAVARAQFGSRVFVRAVVEVSNYCRENCHYCGMRRDNRALDRYRSEVDSLGELLLNQRPSSVTDINFQAGEDPVAVREVVVPLLRLLRNEPGLGLSVCLGTLNHSLANEVRASGAQVYIIKFELADAARYSALEAPGTFDERVAYIRWLAAEGWLVSSGFIAGLPGASVESELQNLRFAATLPLRGCSVSPFIPGEATPLSAEPVAPIDLTLNCMAALRLMQPDWVIPAVSALNLAGPEAGYRRGLRTGANLCTINLTPDSVRGDYLLYKRDRFIMNEERILQSLAAEGLEPSTESLADSLGAGRSLAAA